jgi:hypothetical protein
MKAPIDKQQFGPWALVTGASSGIGTEFARQFFHPSLSPPVQLAESYLTGARFPQILQRT